MTKEKSYHIGVKAIIRNRQDQILILKRSGENYWDLPGGRVQEDEEILDTLYREILEETGLSQIQNIQSHKMILTPFRISTGQGQSVGLIFYYHSCRVNDDAAITLSEEHSEYKWSSISDVKLLLSPKITQVFDSVFMKEVGET